MDLLTYERARTVCLLLRYFRTALLVGRMPSIVGREIFRTKVRSTPARALEEAVVFVCDMERVLRGLAARDQRLLAICIFEDRSEWEAARAVRCGQHEISRRLGEVLDLLHGTFCNLGLLPPPVKLPQRTDEFRKVHPRETGGRNAKKGKNEKVEPPKTHSTEHLSR